MPQFNRKVPEFKPQKPTVINWDNFRGGLNSFLDPTEIQGNELAQADNLLLSGAGIPSKRWGSGLYFLAGATGAVRGITSYYNGSTNELLALTDWGYLTKKSGASYSALTGASWPSGYEATFTQLDNKVYISSQGRELVKYTGTALINFATIAIPTMSTITNLSGASGIGELTQVSYRVSAEGEVGETLGATAISLASVQADPLEHRVRVTWGAVSTASGDLTGYVIYGREPGNETFIARVNSYTTTYDDDGDDVPSLTVNPPTADSTGGHVAKFIIRYKDRLIMAGLTNSPTKVVVSGRVPNQEKFHWSYGGAYVLVDPDSGENITGLGVLREKILVFKERSIWELTLGTVTVGNYTLTDPTYQLLTASHGSVSHKTVVPVEDDVFFLSRRGVYAIGFKPNILNVLSTTEISAKVRNITDIINPNKWSQATAEYRDYKYILTYPTIASNYPNQQLIFDRERGAWMGPWFIAANNLFRYYDSSNNERLVYGSSVTPNIYELSDAYSTDEGIPIETTLRTKKEDFGSWNLFKTIKDVFLQFKDVKGAVNVDLFIEERTGIVAAAKNFTITPTTGNSGWGSFIWGDFQWGDSEESAGSGDVSEVLRWINTNVTGRSAQVQVRTTSSSANYKLLGVKMEAQQQGKGSIPASYRV
jgi:hypothetical protein